MPNPIDTITRSEIVNRVKNGERVIDLASEFGISDKTVYGWIREETFKAPSALTFGKLKRERDDLLKIIGTLTLELSNTKKKRNGGKVGT